MDNNVQIQTVLTGSSLKTLKDYFLNSYYASGRKPLGLSAGVPEEGGVGRPLVTHHSMELAAHPLPAPSSFLPEA